MKCSLAATTAALLAVTGGLVLGTTAANAAPADVYLPVADIHVSTDSADEGDNYNSWHSDPDQKLVVGADTQKPHGFLLPAGSNTQIRLGNGNDAVKTDPTHVAEGPSITELAESLKIVVSNPATASTTFQIPVFYFESSVLKFTTLRQNINASVGEEWESSNAIGAINANQKYDLAQIVGALPGDARAIAAGFLVQNNAAPVLISSFTANGQTTRFYEAPAAPDAVNPQQAPEFVHWSNIRENEDIYAGWHQGVDPEVPDLGMFQTMGSTGQFTGLLVTGRSQILNGYEEANYTNNNLPEILEAGVHVSSQYGSSAEGFTFQVPVFYFTEGVVGPQFTTLRTEIPANGIITAGGEWTSSGASGSTGTLESLLSSMVSYQIIGHGFFVQSGSVTVTSVNFNGEYTSFATIPAVVEEEKPAADDKLAATGAENGMLPMVALALAALGGVALVTRRLQRSKA